MKLNKPNFFLVGAAKAGTTSLAKYLSQNPEIFIPERKECRYFSQMTGNFKGPGDEHVNNTIIRSYKEYLELFVDSDGAKAIGDVSPDYLYYYKTTTNNIKKYIPEPKIIMILRNPVDRALSQYKHFLRDGRETLKFDEALSYIKTRMDNNWEWAWNYIEVGFYYYQVQAYLNCFGREKVKIYLYDDLIVNQNKLLKDICRFLDVNPFFNFDTNIIYNTSDIPRSRYLNNLIQNYNTPLKRLIRPLLLKTIGHEKTKNIANYLKKFNTRNISMNDKTRRYLLHIYKDDIIKLQDLINRDLSHWLK